MNLSMTLPCGSRGGGLVGFVVRWLLKTSPDLVPVILGTARSYVSNTDNEDLR